MRVIKIQKQSAPGNRQGLFLWMHSAADRQIVAIGSRAYLDMRAAFIATPIRSLP
jgi:hypothetical protein